MPSPFPPENPKINFKYHLISFLSSTFKNIFKLVYVRNQKDKIYLVVAKRGSNGKYHVPLTIDFDSYKETKIYLLHDDGSLSNTDGSNFGVHLQWIGFDKAEAVYMMMSHPENYQKFNAAIQAYEDSLKPKDIWDTHGGFGTLV